MKALGYEREVDEEATKPRDLSEVLFHVTEKELDDLIAFLLYVKRTSSQEDMCKPERLPDGTVYVKAPPMQKDALYPKTASMPKDLSELVHFHYRDWDKRWKRSESDIIVSFRR